MFKRELLISGILLNQLDIEDEYKAEKIDTIILRGKENSIELYSLTQFLCEMKKASLLNKTNKLVIVANPAVEKVLNNYPKIQIIYRPSLEKVKHSLPSLTLIQHLLMRTEQ